MRRWKAHRGKIASLSFSRDGQFLASVTGRDRDVHVWHASSGELVRKLTVKDIRGAMPYGVVLAVAFAPGADLLVVSRGNYSEMWGTRTWDRVAECMHEYMLTKCETITVDMGRNPLIACASAWHIGLLRRHLSTAYLHFKHSWVSDGKAQLAFSTDGRLLATHFAKAVVLWRTTSGKEIRRLSHVSDGSPTPVRFSPDSTRLAFCYTKTIESWPATLDDPDAVIRYSGHTDKVWMLRYTPDGRRLISASSDGTVREWEAATGAEIRCFEWKVGKIAAADVSPDGMIAAVGGANGEIVVWDLD